MRASSERWTWWKWMLLDSVAVNTFTGTLTIPKVRVPFQSERAAMGTDYPESVEKHRELLDRGAVGGALLLAGRAEVQQADRELVVGQQCGEDRDGPPVARKPSGVGGEEDDVGRDSGRQHVLVVLLRVPRLLDRDRDQGACAVELGSGA